MNQPIDAPEALESKAIPSLDELRRQDFTEARFSEIPYAAIAMTWYYLLLAALHWVYLPPELRLPLITTAVLASAAAFVIASSVKRIQDISYTAAIVLQLCLCFLGGINVFLHLYMTGDIHQSSNVMLLFMLVAYMRLSKAALIWSTLFILIVWIAILNLINVDSPDLVIHYAFAIVFAAFICGIIRLAQLSFTERRLKDWQARLEAEGALAKATAEFRYQAEHDPLTGLANRRRMRDWIARQWQRDHVFTVMICDIDQFKQFNDEYGHAGGDRVLSKISQLIIEQSELHGGLPVRLGGDELALILPNVDQHTAGEICQSICRKVRELASFERVVTVSLGSFTSDGTGALDQSYLLKSADDALYQAKAAGRDGYICK